MAYVLFDERLDALSIAGMVVCAAGVVLVNLHSLRSGPGWGEVAWGALGIALIATANLGVSFFLALRTAARARDLAPADWRRLTAALRAAFRKDPRRFLWRPRKSAVGG